jgi:hypothetical protein
MVANWTWFSYGDVFSEAVSLEVTTDLRHVEFTIENEFEAMGIYLSWNDVNKLIEDLQDFRLAMEGSNGDR